MKIFSGKVISKKMDKTIGVSVDRVFSHPRYIKRVKRSRKYLVHDENNQAKPGDIVRFVASRPYSKTKRWKLVEIVNIDEPKTKKSKKGGKSK